MHRSIWLISSLILVIISASIYGCSQFNEQPLQNKVLIGAAAVGAGAVIASSLSKTAAAATTTTTTTSSTTTTTGTGIVTPTFNPSNVSSEVLSIGGNIVTREVVSNIVVASLASGKSKSDLTASLPAGYSIVGENPVNGVYEIAIPTGKTLSAAITEIAALSSVSEAGHDIVFKNFYTPNDPYFNTSHITDRWPYISSEATWAWDLVTGDAHVLIAILDSGLDLDHTEFTGRIINGPDYVDGNTTPEDVELFGHGTEVAGMAAATGNNSSMIAGMNWHAPVLVVRVCSQEGGSTNALANAVTYVAEQYGDSYDGIIINSSVGVALDPSIAKDAALINALAKAAATCSRHNVLWVAPSGNENIDIDSTPVYPAALSQVATMPVISVGGHNRSGGRWSGNYDVGFRASNYGNGVDLCAAGGEILTTSMNNGVSANQWGTSLSSPLVAGAASLIKSLFNSQSISLTPTGLIGVIIDGGDTISADHPIGKKLNLKGAILNGLGLHNKTVLSLNCNIGGANISIEGVDSGKATTTEGYTRIIVGEGTKTISVRKSGYNTSSNSVSFTAGTEKILNVTLEASAGFITGEANSSFTIDNGLFWIKTNYTSSSSRNFLDQIGISGQSNWLNRATYPTPCLTQAEPFYTGNAKDRSLTLRKNTSSIAAYQSQFTVTSESKALTVTWEFIVPSNKKYAIWVCSYESTGTDKNITVDNPSNYGVQDIYFFYPMQPTPETSTYITCESDSVAVSWSASAATDYYSTSNRHFSIYNAGGCFTFGYFGSYCSSDPYLYYLNSEMGYKSMFTTTKKVTLSAASPTATWMGMIAFHDNVANAGSLYADALSNLSTYLSQASAP